MRPTGSRWTCSRRGRVGHRPRRAARAWWRSGNAAHRARPGGRRGDRPRRVVAAAGRPRAGHPARRVGALRARRGAPHLGGGPRAASGGRSARQGALMLPRSIASRADPAPWPRAHRRDARPVARGAPSPRVGRRRASLAARDGDPLGAGARAGRPAPGAARGPAHDRVRRGPVRSVGSAGRDGAGVRARGARGPPGGTRRRSSPSAATRSWNGSRGARGDRPDRVGAGRGRRRTSGGALRLASRAVPRRDPEADRAVSDGNDTTGRGQSEAALAAARGVRIETYEVGLGGADEVIVQRADRPATARVGEEIEAEVTISSTVAQPATVRLFGDGTQIGVRAGAAGARPDAGRVHVERDGGRLPYLPGRRGGRQGHLQPERPRRFRHDRQGRPPDLLVVGAPWRPRTWPPRSRPSARTWTW